MVQKLSGIVWMTTAVWATVAIDADNDPPLFVFNGFGTLGVVRSSDTEADFVG